MTMDIGGVHGCGPDHFGLVTSDGEGAVIFARHVSAIGNLSGHTCLPIVFGLVRNLWGVFSGVLSPTWVILALGYRSALDV
jgi:hypothetical protein